MLARSLTRSPPTDQDDNGTASVLVSPSTASPRNLQTLVGIGSARRSRSSVAAWVNASESSSSGRSTPSALWLRCRDRSSLIS